MRLGFLFTPRKQNLMRLSIFYVVTICRACVHRPFQVQ